MLHIVKNSLRSCHHLNYLPVRLADNAGLFKCTSVF
jgi:hypothetical protein